MARPPLEVADLIRAAGDAFIERNRRWLRWKHIKVLLAIRRCRTATLGGHLDECTRCGYRAAISYNSCRNRHCPKCQIAARERWIAARRQELLPTRYLHVVFTLPHRLAPLVLQNKKVLYGLLFRTSAETLLEFARNPRHLGAEIGFFSVLHTWNQRLQHHPHVHCVAAAGGLTPDHMHWIPSRHTFFLPVKVLSRVFRGKFVAGLKHALRYLSGYTHRIAISNRRLVALEQGNVTFRWRDSAHANKQRLLTLPVDEFLRRFLLHLLPRGFMRIRNFGFLANRRRAALLPLCFQSLASAADVPARTTSPAADHPCSSTYWNCPVCGGSMHVVERLSAAQLLPRSP